MAKTKRLSVAKAKKIMHEGEVHGHELTEKQKGFFGARAGGQPMMTMGKGMGKSMGAGMKQLKRGGKF